MLFNSFAFLVFFPVTTLTYFSLPHRARWALLLAASCIFYMAFVPVYILVLAFTIVVDYFAGIAIEHAVGGRRRGYLLFSLAANIGILAVFKYYNFVSVNVTAFAEFFHLHNPMPVLNILLPIGLSFHTFQAMSYTIEVYRGKQAAERHFGVYALYVMFYPQLVAGPIERPQNLLHQFREPHAFDYDRVVRGLKLMTFGMFKKVVIADRLAAFVNAIYDKPHHFHGAALLFATIFFSFQIYYDFSGYTDIALGAAEVMGFRLMKNFATPYFAASISEFWRRWHISLSTWFRDYVYFPLGGNRVSRPRWYMNLLIVFMLSGLWHGARWTFVVWGALHGCFLVCAEITKPLRARTRAALSINPDAALSRFTAIISTFFLVMVAWVFFRATSCADAAYIIGHMFRGLPTDLRGALHGADIGVSTHQIAARLLLISAMLAVEWLDRDAERDVARSSGLFVAIARWPSLFRFGFYFALVYSCFFFGAPEQQFIYFQF